MNATCPCGSVTLSLKGEPIGQVYCHCDDCQHAHGAAYVPRAIFPSDAVSVAHGNIHRWTNRIRKMVMCPGCGAHLYGEHDGVPFRGVNASLFPKGRFKPTAHIHCAFAVAPVVDDLPHYQDTLAEYGGSGKRMLW